MLNEQPRWLQGRHVLITGGAGTFGAALVEEAVRQGAIVAASGRKPRINEVQFDDGVAVLDADLADPDACHSLPRRVVEAIGGLDVLVNNAAVLVRRPFLELDAADLDDAWAVNARAPALLIRASVPFMVTGVRPSVINVVSTAGFNGGVATVSAYAMTKAALIVLSKALARELGPLGIRVNCFSPGSMDSRMQASLDSESRQKVAKMNVLGQPLRVCDIARAALFLASDHAGTVTGTTLDATAVVP